MNDEQQRQKRRAKTLDERLSSDPQLKERVHQIADLRDELIAQGCSLDEVEAAVVEQIRLLGKELLGSIAQQKCDASAQQAIQKNPLLSRDSKKIKMADDSWAGAGHRTGITGGASRGSTSALLPGGWAENWRVLQTIGAGADGFWS
jgi:hypothetical protein